MWCAKLEVTFITVSTRKTPTVVLSVKCQDCLNVPTIFEKLSATIFTSTSTTIAEVAIDHLEYSVQIKVESPCKKPADGNFNLDNAVNELMYDMMMKVNCITFISTIVLILFKIF